MSIEQIVRAWRDPLYRQRLSADERPKLPENPAGASLSELDDAELLGVVGGNTQNSYCECYTSEGSCGRLCTFTSECPIMTWICC